MHSYGGTIILAETSLAAHLPVALVIIIFALNILSFILTAIRDLSFGCFTLFSLSSEVSIQSALKISVSNM